MIKDIYAEYGAQNRDNLIRIQKDKGVDVFTKLSLLSIFLGTSIEEIARIHYRSIIYLRDDKPSSFSENIILPALDMIKQHSISPPSDILTDSMPFGSFFLQFTFTLAKPYISRDDEKFYIIDNPVRKDKVFNIPMVSGSSWKGNMRWTAMKIFTDGLLVSKDVRTLNECLRHRGQLVRLFGHEKDATEDYLDNVLAEALCNDKEKEDSRCIEEKKGLVKKEFEKFLRKKSYIGSSVEGRRGRLNFYPTFFNQISLEVINPHDRKTKAGTIPIYIESVPEVATGTFSLLYVPFDLMGKPEAEMKREVAEDLDIVYNSLKEMMLTYGFSAKKSSGFGVINTEIEGTFEMSGYPVYKDVLPATQKADASSPFAILASIKFDTTPDPLLLIFSDLSFFDNLNWPYARQYLYHEFLLFSWFQFKLKILFFKVMVRGQFFFVHLQPPIAGS